MMSEPLPMTRRRLLKTLFCSSVALHLNPAAFGAPVPIAQDHALELFAVGDFGTGDEPQRAVSRGMIAYAKTLGKPSDGLLLLGDNFYGAMKEGVKSPRFKTGFSETYPGTVFPGPAWPILGNHDYHDNKGNEFQPAYAASLDRKTRWTMPGTYYRVDLPAINPKITMLMIDTNWESINRRVHGDKVPCWISEEDRKKQLAWLQQQLESKRAPLTMVIGHHPLYSDGSHGDTPELIADIGPLLEKHGVQLYLGGHDHDLQHLELAGRKTSFVISGGGGARLHHYEKKREGSTGMDVFGFSHLSISNDRILLRHIDPNGKIVHAFSKGVNCDWKVEA